MTGPMLTRFIILLATTLVIHMVCGLGFLWQKNSAIDSQESEMADLRTQWDEEDAERKAFQEQELQSKYGTSKLDRIVFDPRLDINLVLLKLFEAAMPSEYLVEVKTDRFTEFSIYVNVYNMPHTSDLAGYLKEVFSRVKPRYAYQVIFTDEDRYWVIDHNKLMRISDWKNASISDIKKKCFRS